MSVSPMYSLTLSKTDYQTQTMALAGAEFTVYSAYDFADAGNNVEVSLLTSLESGSYTSTFTTGNDGTLTIYGLRPNQTYYLVETKSPSDYPLQKYVIEIVVDSSGNATVTVYDEDGDEIGTESYAYSSSGTGTNTTELDSGSWQFLKAGSLAVSAGPKPSEGDDYNVSFTVTNDYRYELPATGSIGVFPYKRAGSICVLTAITGLLITALSGFARRRKQHAEKHRQRTPVVAANHSRNHTRTRDHPRKRKTLCGGNLRGHPRDGPGDSPGG